MVYVIDFEHAEKMALVEFAQIALDKNVEQKYELPHLTKALIKLRETIR